MRALPWLVRMFLAYPGGAFTERASVFQLVAFGAREGFGGFQRIFAAHPPGDGSPTRVVVKIEVATFPAVRGSNFEAFFVRDQANGHGGILAAEKARESRTRPP